MGCAQWPLTWWGSLTHRVRVSFKKKPKSSTTQHYFNGKTWNATKESLSQWFAHTVVSFWEFTFSLWHIPPLSSLLICYACRFVLDSVLFFIFISFNPGKPQSVEASGTAEEGERGGGAEGPHEVCLDPFIHSSESGKYSVTRSPSCSPDARAEL